jgi:hypothetical protein
MKVNFRLKGAEYTIVAGIVNMIGFSTLNSISNNKGCVGLHVMGLRVPFVSVAILVNYDFGAKVYVSSKHNKYNPQA